jgi:hypothetical protein
MHDTGPITGNAWYLLSFQPHFSTPHSRFLLLCLALALLARLLILLDEAQRLGLFLVPHLRTLVDWHLDLKAPNLLLHSSRDNFSALLSIPGDGDRSMMQWVLE